MNKKTIWALVILVVLAVVLGGLYCYKVWWPKKEIAIQAGLAKSTFPWRAYTQEELNKMYPQIKYADVPTRVTPEQTYANFREALRTNNLEMALEQLSKSSEKRYKDREDIFKNAYQDEKFNTLYRSYPEKIEKESMYESIASYYYITVENGERFQNPIAFTKDANGDWKMDSL